MFVAGAAVVAAVAASIAVNVLTGDPGEPLPAGLGWLHPLWRSWTAVVVLTGLSVVLAVQAARQDEAPASGPAPGSSLAAAGATVGTVRGHGQVVVGATGTVTGPVHAQAGTVIQQAHHVTVYPPAPPAGSSPAPGPGLGSLEQNEANVYLHQARTAATQDGGRARLEALATVAPLAATGAARDALSALLDLGAAPDQERDLRILMGQDPERVTADLGPADEAEIDAWRHGRQKLLRAIRLAILDIGDAELRARLDESLLILQLWLGPLKYAGQPESRTRYLAATDALESLGAFRRGDPLPQRSAEYVSTNGFVLDYREELESNSMP